MPLAPTQGVKYINITPPAAIIDNASAATAEIDRKGFDYLTVVVQLGALDIAMTALKVTESDASGTGHTDITGLVFGTSTLIDGSASVLPLAVSDNQIYVFNLDLRSRKRYIDVTATCGDGAAGTYISILGILSRPDTALITSTGYGTQGVLEV